MRNFDVQGVPDDDIIGRLAPYESPDHEFVEETPDKDFAYSGVRVFLEPAAWARSGGVGGRSGGLG